MTLKQWDMVVALLKNDRPLDTQDLNFLENIWIEDRNLSDDEDLRLLRLYDKNVQRIYHKGELT